VIDGVAPVRAWHDKEDTRSDPAETQ